METHEAKIHRITTEKMLAQAKQELVELRMEFNVRQQLKLDLIEGYEKDLKDRGAQEGMSKK